MLDEGLRALVAQYGVEGPRKSGVLLVDDERPNLLVLRGFLESGYTVYEAESGRQALEVADKSEIDVVIADQRMPEMTGVEMLEELRSRKPDVAGIVLTGFTDPPALISAINRARVFRFLKKPWQPEDILEAVRQACEHVYQTRTIQRLVALLARRTEELTASLGVIETTHRQMLHLERLGTMGRLAAGITHDLRNVMISVNFIERELQQQKASPDLLESVHVGTQGIHNLLETLEAMHQFASAGAIHLATDKVAPAQVVQGAIAIARMDLNFRARKVDVQVQEDLPFVQGDRQKLIQVLVNLVRNALQATERSRRISIQASRDADDVVLAVEDEGPGVPRELQEKIFEPFVSTKGDRGMGMGLYMAKLIVESHRGRIRVSNRPSGGARFEVRLAPASA
jgi:signal transduction histidine kinase